MVDRLYGAFGEAIKVDVAEHRCVLDFMYANTALSSGSAIRKYEDNLLLDVWEDESLERHDVDLWEVLCEVLSHLRCVSHLEQLGGYDECEATLLSE